MTASDGILHHAADVRAEPERNPASPPLSTVDQVAETWVALTARWHTRIELLAAELSLAAKSGSAIVILSLVVAGLILTGWLLLMGIAGFVLIDAGLSPPATGALLVLIQGVSVATLWRAVCRLSVEMTLPRTRHLGNSPKDTA